MTRLTILFLFASTLANAQPVKEQQKKGTVTSYYPGTKQVRYAGAVHKHLREATWVFYSQAGERVKTEEYRAGMLHGKTEIYFRQIKIASEQYADNLLHGPQQYFDKTGQLMQTQYFTAGVVDSIYNYDEGEKYQREKLYLRNGKIYRRHEYYRRGILSETGCYDEKGLKTGIWRKYYPAREAGDTVPDGVTTYVKGKQNGPAYFKDYLTRTDCYYVNDTLDGPYLRTSFDGGRYIANYKMGQRQGLEQKFKSGILVEENEWLPDGNIGMSKNYYDSGELRYQQFFAKGSKGQGLPDSIHWFYPSGKRNYYEIFRKEGEITYRELTFWYENGKLYGVEFYNNGMKDSTWKSYSDKGKLLRVNRYREDHFHGLQQVWWDNGRKKIEVNYQNGKQLHPVKAWKPDGTPADLRSPAVEAWEEWAQMDVRLLPVMVSNKYGGSGNEEVNVMHTSGDADESELVIVNGDSDPPVMVELNENMRITWQESNPKPEFPGGQEALQQFIRDNLHYPAAEKARGFSCTVQLTFIVNKEGVLENIYAFRKPTRSPAFGVEAERLASTMPRWKPGMKNGKVYSVAMTLDIPFTLPAK